ncbi:MAG: UDP-N-acetylmuramoyl-L-alanyl-D-glutamate--2,6-diaminopimelate ligase [Candidatus Nanopelagicales bacterium]
MLRPTGVRMRGADLRRTLGLPEGPPAEVTGITLDSRRVRPGDVYAALPGFTTHGARFAAMAQGSGALAVLTDPTGAQIVAANDGVDVPVLVVADPRAVLGALSAAIYGHPSAHLATTGITGTNGKTTTSYLLDAALRAAGRTTGLIGTVATHVGDEILPSARTTPEAPDVHALLAVMRQRGASAVTMEVSSHALSLGRVDGIRFDLAVFTNLSQDHLDFHGDMASYFAAKADLFTPARAAAGLVCIDDAWGQRLAADAGLPITTYALDRPADWTASALAPGPHGSTTFTVHGPAGDLPAAVMLPGRFNVANALAALAAAVHHGVVPVLAADAIAACPGVPGRMERVLAGQSFLAIVDYAHTPDAVDRAISAARESVPGRVLVVLGCGGDRDRDKRPRMGQVAAAGADVLIVTDDNPRSESPTAIRADMMTGAAQVPDRQRAQLHEVGDRRLAIRAAVDLAGQQDCVLILGKGHEQGQEVAGGVSSFDDRVELAAALHGADEEIR